MATHCHHNGSVPKKRSKKRKAQGIRASISDLYKRNIYERTRKQMAKCRESQGVPEAERLKSVNMLLKSSVLTTRELDELRVVATLLSPNIDTSEKIMYLLEDADGDRVATFVLWFNLDTHPLGFAPYFLRGDGDVLRLALRA